MVRLSFYAIPLLIYDVMNDISTGLTLPFAIVAICYKNDRVATDLFHWRKVHFRQIKSPFLPLMVQNLLTGDLYVNTCILLCGDFQYWPDWVT